MSKRVAWSTTSASRSGRISDGVVNPVDREGDRDLSESIRQVSSVDGLQLVDLFQRLVHRDPVEDLHGVPLDHAALNREVPHRLDVLRPDNRDALVLRRNDRPGEILNPQPLGQFRHFRSSIQEELPDGLVGGRTLVWRMRRDDGELLHSYTPDPHWGRPANTFVPGVATYDLRRASVPRRHRSPGKAEA